MIRLIVEEIGPGWLREVERAAIIRALRESGGHAETAADLIGIGHSTMYRKIQEHRISDEERY